LSKIKIDLKEKPKEEKEKIDLHGRKERRKKKRTWKRKRERGGEESGAAFSNESI